MSDFFQIGFIQVKGPYSLNLLILLNLLWAFVLHSCKHSFYITLGLYAFVMPLQVCYAFRTLCVLYLIPDLKSTHLLIHITPPILPFSFASYFP